MIKSIGNSFWVAYGKTGETRGFDTASLTSLHSPFLVGHGRQVSLFGRTLRVGVCTPLYRGVNVHDEDDGLAYVVGARSLDTEEQPWEYSEQTEQATPAQEDSASSDSPPESLVQLIEDE